MVPELSFVLFSIGSNLGDRKANISKAIALLLKSEIFKKISVSSFYETEPVGFTAQPWFINVAVSAWSDADIMDILTLCRKIEERIGRISRPKWHEREIDIDILIYGSKIIEETQLSVPHPRMHERKFVLVPAAEIAGNFVHPKFRKTLQELLDDCNDKAKVDVYRSLV